MNTRNMIIFPEIIHIVPEIKQVVKPSKKTEIGTGNQPYLYTVPFNSIDILSKL